MHPAFAHDVVQQHMRQRLDEAAAERLGSRRRSSRRTGRRNRRTPAPEPKLRTMVVAPLAT